MEAYESILQSAKEGKRITAHIAGLGKIRPYTEDKALLSKIDRAIETLQNMHLTIKKGKSMPVCLDMSTNPNIRALVEYCENALTHKKPEWMIIAEREGWGPIKE